VRVGGFYGELEMVDGIAPEPGCGAEHVLCRTEPPTMAGPLRKIMALKPLAHRVRAADAVRFAEISVTVRFNRGGPVALG
jgi:hypothetical protein